MGWVTVTSGTSVVTTKDLIVFSLFITPKDPKLAFLLLKIYHECFPKSKALSKLCVHFY